MQTTKKLQNPFYFGIDINCTRYELLVEIMLSTLKEYYENLVSHKNYILRKADSLGLILIKLGNQLLYTYNQYIS